MTGPRRFEHSNGRLVARAGVAAVAGLILCSVAGCASAPVVRSVVSHTVPGVHVDVRAQSSIRLGEPFAVTATISNTTGHPIVIPAGRCVAWLDFGLVRAGDPAFEGAWPQPACEASVLPVGTTTQHSMLATKWKQPGTYTIAGATRIGGEAEISFGMPVKVTLHR
jgi:hypothetical protein